MSLPEHIERRLTAPIVCAPMFLISGPALVIEARKAGFIGAFPRQNTRSLGEFERWLIEIEESIGSWEAESGRLAGPLAVNIPTKLEAEDMRASMDLCARHGVDIVITSVGKPDQVVREAHDRGMLVHHDATSVAFAEKAIAAGVDGLNCIGAGGGGHSGTVSHLALIPRVREMFDGTISLAGAVSNGAAVRAAEVLGADLAFVGTRFAATQESLADPEQKRWFVSDDSTRLRYTAKVNGVPANWMVSSLESHGINVDRLPDPVAHSHEHLPSGVRPWRDLWSAGQGIDLIHDIPTCSDLADRLCLEYLDACLTPDRRRAILATAPHPSTKESLA